MDGIQVVIILRRRRRRRRQGSGNDNNTNYLQQRPMTITTNISRVFLFHLDGTQIHLHREKFLKIKYLNVKSLEIYFFISLKYRRVFTTD